MWSGISSAIRSVSGKKRYQFLWNEPVFTFCLAPMILTNMGCTKWRPGKNRSIFHQSRKNKLGSFKRPAFGSTWWCVCQGDLYMILDGLLPLSSLRSVCSDVQLSIPFYSSNFLTSMVPRFPIKQTINEKNGKMGDWQLFCSPEEKGEVENPWKNEENENKKDELKH